MKFEREETFRRNENLERLLKEINGILEPVEDRIIEGYGMPKYPVIFVVAMSRCGSTLMMQWLANTGRFAYPTNLLSRFYEAPYIGAKIQQLLTAPEFNFRGEILDFNSDISFTSDIGKTKGALAPNEFWYFWRRFLPNTEAETDYMDKQCLKEAKCKEFAAELAAVEAVFNKPLAMKGHILRFNIPFLSSILEKALTSNLYWKRELDIMVTEELGLELNRGSFICFKLSILLSKLLGKYILQIAPLKKDLGRLTLHEAYG